MSNGSVRDLSGLEKAAALVLALGTENSAQLLTGLKPADIELLAGQVARTRTVDEETRARVLQEFQAALAASPPPEGGLAYARQLLTQTLGEDLAAGVIARLEFASQAVGFSIEGEKEADRLGRLLRREHLQITAAVLSQLPPSLGGRVLGSISKEDQLEVALRLLDMDSPDVETLRLVAQSLKTGLISEQPAAVTPADGTRRLAEILNSADWETEQRVMGEIGKHDAELAKQVRDKMFVFDDLIELEPRELQLVLRSVSQDDLRMALHACGERLKEYILSNMSERAAAALKEDMETAGPVKPKQARAAQQRVAATARRLAQEGTMTLRKAVESEEEPLEEGAEEGAAQASLAEGTAPEALAQEGGEGGDG